MRTELELVALRLARRGVNRSVLGEMETVAAEMREVLAAGRTFGYPLLDIRFHGLIARLCDNTRLASIYDDLSAQYRIRPAYLFNWPAGMAQSPQEHEGIVNTLVAGDLARASDRSVEHYQHARLRSERRIKPDEAVLG